MVEVVARVRRQRNPMDARVRPVARAGEHRSFRAPRRGRQSRRLCARRQVEQAGGDSSSTAAPAWLTSCQRQRSTPSVRGCAPTGARPALRRALSAHRRGEPAPATSGIRDPASQTIRSGSAPSTTSRIAIEHVCQPLAIRPFQRADARALDVRMKPLRIVGVGEREDLRFGNRRGPVGQPVPG